MGEADAIERVDEPVTVGSLVEDLRDLGVSSGDTLLVHASLGALGWVCGGAPTVIDALQRVLTGSGTLVMPTHTTQYTDPAGWADPPVPASWVGTIRDAMPPYRPAVTPTRSMGAVPECFRRYPGVVRSRHPVYSFAAWGAEASAVAGDHALDDGLGEGSPLARAYELDGDILLLGVGHDRNTSLHLAEYRADLDVATTCDRAPVLDGDEVVYVECVDIELTSDDFEALGADYERENRLVDGTVGAAPAKRLDQRGLVDYAVDWLAANR